MLVALISLSDEVEARVSIFKSLIDDRRILVSSTSLADQSSKSMGVSNAGWLLNRTRHVIVGVT